MLHYVAPVSGPADYPPWVASTREKAEFLKEYLEQEYRNRYTMELIITPEGETKVVFSYPPDYLFNMRIV